MYLRNQLPISDVDAKILAFGQALKPSDEFKREGKELAQQVFLTLQEHSRYSVVAPRHSGSFGKNTDVLEPDLDLVIVVNCPTHPPPFEDILDDFKRILERFSSHLRINPGSIQRYHMFNALQFTFLSGLNADILPAVDLDRGEILRRIGASQDPCQNWKDYSSSLIKEQVGFIKSCGTYEHTLIRLAKLWLRSIHFPHRKLYGGSTMMELIAVAAAKDVESSSITAGLFKVFDMMIEFSSIKLAFEKNHAYGTWAVVAQHRLGVGGRMDSSLIPHAIGRRHILDRNHFIMDPSNPFNDLLRDKNKEEIAILERCARVTKLKLSELLTGKYIFRNGTINFLKLFKPQPNYLEKLYPAGIPNRAIIRYSYEGYHSPYSYLKENYKNIPRRINEKQRNLFVKALRTDLISLVNTIVIRVEQEENDGSSDSLSLSFGSGGSLSPSEVIKKAVKSSVKKMCKERLYSMMLLQSNDPRDHERMDVTLYIPYTVENHVYSVRFSMSW